MTRAEKARDYFMQGYACSQSVALAFTDLTTLTEEEILKATIGFGGGFGRLRLVCGAISGMTTIVGLIFSKNENSQQNKLDTYAVVRELCDEFSKEVGSLICQELLNASKAPITAGAVPQERTSEYYQKRPCGELVYLAADILEKYLQKKGVI